MPRQIYTERDIEDLARRGVTELKVDDSIYLTDIARERMDRLGIRRILPESSTTTSGASVTSNRPMAATPGVSGATPPTGAGSATTANLSPADREQVVDKVKQGVIARLGPGVDAAVVDQIVRRVVSGL